MIYVSSKLKHRAMWLPMEKSIISSWIHGSDLPPSECSAMWDRYADEILMAERFLLYLEDGDLPKGMLVELGMAFACGIPITIIWTGSLERLAAILGTIVYHDSVTVIEKLENFV